MRKEFLGKLYAITGLFTTCVFNAKEFHTTSYPKCNIRVSLQIQFSRANCTSCISYSFEHQAPAKQCFKDLFFLCLVEIVYQTLQGLFQKGSKDIFRPNSIRYYWVNYYNKNTTL